MGYGDLRPESYGKLCDQDFVKSRLGDMVDPSERPVLCLGDNKGSNQLTLNEVLHKRSKHIDVSYQISRRMCKAGYTIFCFIGTKGNIADLMTKSLARPTHSYLANKIMYQFRDGQILDVYGKPVDMPLNDPVRDDLYLSVPKGLTPTKGDGIFPPQPSVPSWSIPLHPKSLGPMAPLGGRAEDDQAITETVVLDKVLQRVIELAMDRVTA